MKIGYYVTKILPSLGLAAALGLGIMQAPAHAWDKTDTLLQGAYMATHITDWGQTRSISESCNSDGRYYETNLVMGTCPSMQTVNLYFIGTGLLHVGVAHTLPKKYRRMFQLGTLGMQINYISNNQQLGLKVSF